MASWMWNPTGRGYFSAVIFFAEKKEQKTFKKRKIEKRPRARWDSALVTSITKQTQRTQKTEFALGNHIKNTFFERNKNELQKLEK